MTITSLNNYSFAFNDFVFGGADSVYQVMTVDGLEDLPSIRVQDDNRGYFDGMWTGRDFLSGRTITIVITVRGDVNYTMNYYLNLLQENLKPQTAGTGVLQFQFPGNTLQRVNARVRRRSIQINTNYSSGLATATYEFFCPDPLIYDNTLNELELYGTSAITGRTYNRVYNMVYGTGGQTANLCENIGWTNTYPVFTIKGPCINPQINDTNTGNVLSIVYSMQTSDTLILDTNLRSVTLNGVNRRSLLTNNSTWFSMTPGNNYYRFTAASGTGTGTSCVVSWRSAFIQEIKMALRTPPSWLQNGSHPAENDRLTITNTIWANAGVVDYGDMLVAPTPTPSMAVTVAAGAAIITGTQTVTQGNYIAYNDASATLSIAAANPSLARIDRVCVVVQDAYYGGTANNQVIFQVVTGTASASPVAPTAPENSITLALVQVAANASSINTGAITDQRGYASFTDINAKSSNIAADSIKAQAIASQTGKLLNLLNSSGASVFNVSPSGVLTFQDGTTQNTSAVYNPNLTINAQTVTSYTLNATDAQKFVTFTNSSPITVTVASNATQNLPVGTQIQLAQLGTGQVTFVGASSPNPVTILSDPGLKLRTQYSVATLVQLSVDTWILIGDTAV